MSANCFGFDKVSQIPYQCFAPVDPTGDYRLTLPSPNAATVYDVVSLRPYVVRFDYDYVAY